MTTHDEMARLLAMGRIGRRDLIKGAAALGAVGAAERVLGRSAMAATPNKGGALKVAIGAGSTTDTLDPATFTDSYMQSVGFGGMRNCLTEIDNTGKLVGELAESWDASPDAKTWTFKIRKGVTFHNGKSLTAEDVIDSINHHRGEDSKSPAKPLLAPITSLKADGDNVVLTLEAGNADLPYLLSDYHIGIMPSSGDGKVDWKSGAGTGGYIIKAFEPGVRSFLERNPNYWKQGRAHFDSVEILSIIDVAARTNALTTGEVHLMDRCDLKTVHLLKRNRDVEIYDVTGTQHYTFPMLTNQAPFDNNDLRLALKYSVNREEMVQKILRGHGKVGNDTPIAPATSFYAELEQRAYDPDKAKFHLKKAGAEGLTIDLSAADAAFAGAVDAAVLYKEHAAKAGITVNVIREPNDGYWSNVWMKKGWSACYWGGRPTADWMFSTAYEAGVAWNDTYWEHEKFNKLLVAARVELDEAKRTDMYREMQTIVRDEGGVVVPMFANYVGASSTKLAHDKLAGNWDMDGHKAVERWWFA
ncbi:MAG: ABC transporter substrate-binding protein [Thalassobaculum sp.]|uniref:ABC transporter substrate-binding protein n=1 Tax=Thalassobaculum sp. TaxID=2022740 RepID=UPI0032ECF60A